MKKYAILIAAEEYLSPDIDKVPHARRDVEAFSQAIVPHGFHEADQILLIDELATKAAIESAVAKTAKKLRPDDSLFFYYVGRGISQSNESQERQNFLLCPDTQGGDWRQSSVALAPLITQIRDAGCERIALFLDHRPGGIRTPSFRGTVADRWAEEELEGLLNLAGDCVCLSASRFHESSHSSDHLHHGIWAYHVIEAFRGEAPLAVDRGLLTAESLQNYVQAETPRTLRKEHSHPPRQTPWMPLGASGHVVLADLRDILAARQQSTAQGDKAPAELTFVATATQEIRTLSSWKQSYRLPDSASAASERFVAGIAKDELSKDLDRVYDALRKAFGFARRDLQSSQPDEGSGTIITPHFNYSITVALDAEDLRQIVWTRTIDAIKSPEQITTSAFGQIFDGVFDTLDLSLPTPLNIEDFIDAVEAAKIPGLQLSYDREATYCQLHLPRTAGAVTIKPGSVSIVHDRPQKTRKLVESFEAVRKLLSRHQVLLP